VPGRGDFCRGRCAGSAAQLHRINAELAKAWPVIVERMEPLADADEWNHKPDKLKYLQRS
jgi:ferredoxin